ncbi:efflux RND transporter periplasmic adaptor subunit [Rahnella inusitata]|uniref:Efflux RND transporter periplasmic adaptor subunit n=2 Tax=Rahnella inusitata TaxID=58169 RepID=A0ABX9NZA0_9GAMM|nr:efflux RND transporter periplasmic adaptor subunit [Rahnella inusitata]QUT17871.1 efflux RND transporter periplasmic adaptor subunit [Rahnella inusitata]RJT10719.1 efflux RND transporter periplasmic adaptor subunit [Rahnella inusitata]
MKKKSVVIWSLVILCAVSATAYFIFNQQHHSSPAGVLAKITRGDIQTTVITTGTLKPIRQVSIGAQVNGQLKKLYVHQGDRVNKGQLLAEIDPILQQNELRKSEAELASARAQLRSSQVLLKQYQLALRRQKVMLREGSGVASDLEEAQSLFDSQLEQLEMNKAQIVQSEMAVETARANVGYTRLVAPIEGEVLGVVTQEGQTIVSSQTAPTIMVLADLSVMHIQTRISEADILKVKSGQPLSFYVLAQPSRLYTSVMGEIQNAPDGVLNNTNEISNNSQQSLAIYYSGVFEITNTERLLKTSMTAQVSIVVNDVKNVLRIPLSALQERDAQGRYYVTLIDGKQRISREVEIGAHNNVFAEVKSGLVEGQSVEIPPLALETAIDG